MRHVASGRQGYRLSEPRRALRRAGSSPRRARARARGPSRRVVTRVRPRPPGRASARLPRRRVPAAQGGARGRARAPPPTSGMHRFSPFPSAMGVQQPTAGREIVSCQRLSAAVKSCQPLSALSAAVSRCQRPQGSPGVARAQDDGVDELHARRYKAIHCSHTRGTARLSQAVR